MISETATLVVMLVVVCAGVFYAGWTACASAQSHRVADATRIAATAQQAADTLLKAAHTERAAADALTVTGREVAAAKSSMEDVRSALASLDGNMGAVLTALHALGALKVVDPNAHLRQRGEGGPGDPPPLDSLAKVREGALR